MLSRGDSGGVARGERMVPPRSERASGYSAGEMRQIGHALRAWRAAHPGVGDPGPDDGWHGHVPGVEAFVERDVQLRAQLARSHPFRLKLLGRVENLPFLLHHEVISLALARPSELLTATSDTFDVEVSDNEPAPAPIVSNLVATLQVLRLLTLLGMSAGRRFPVAGLLTLLYALVALQVLHSAPQAALSTSPPYVTQPPGRFVITQPQIPRAPGRPSPRCSSQSRLRRGCVRQRGALY